MPMTIEQLHEELQKTLPELQSALTERDKQIKTLGEQLGDNKEKFAKLEKSISSYEDTIAELKKQNEAISQSVLDIKRPGAGNVDLEDPRELQKTAAALHYLRTGEMPGDLPADLQKDLTTRDDSQSGYLALPPQLQAGIIKEMAPISPLRTVVKVTPTNALAIARRKQTQKPKAQRIGETQTRTNTQGPAYGVVTISSQEMYAMHPVSRRMLLATDVDLQAEVNAAWAEQFAVAEGEAMLRGDGVDGWPTGMLVDKQITNVNSGDANLLGADDEAIYKTLVRFEDSLPDEFEGNAVYIFSKTTRSIFRQMMDANKRPLWTPAMTAGAPAMINGKPYLIAPDMDAVSAGKFPILYGDFMRGYEYLDVNSITTLRDEISGSKQGMIELMAYKMHGGAAVLPNAIRRLKIAA